MPLKQEVDSFAVRQKGEPMDDLISRQAAIDALGDEPEVWTGRYEYAQGLNNQWHYDRNAIKAVPSTEPEIIRCEDCLHNGSFDTDCPIDWNGKEYCSFAERRTGGNA